MPTEPNAKSLSLLSKVHYTTRYDSRLPTLLHITLLAFQQHELNLIKLRSLPLAWADHKRRDGTSMCES
jgi:prephenate dehydratase